MTSAPVALADRTAMAKLVEKVVVGGDLKDLTSEERLTYYNEVCKSVGVNPLTRPFSYITLNNKLTLYANKDCTDQLRGLKGVSITKLERETVEGVYAVTAYARNKEGREDTSVGAVSIENLRGEAKANAMMKAETKAKRRVTLSICGLGMLDETEVEAIPDARTARIDLETGEIMDIPLSRLATPEPAESEPDADLKEKLERSVVLARFEGAADKLGLDAAARAKLLVKHGVTDPRTADPAALEAMLEELRQLWRTRQLKRDG